MRLEDYVTLDANALAALVREGVVTAAELGRLARQAHDRVNPFINAVVEFYEDAETVTAAAAGAFAGVPFLRKDSGVTEAGRLQERGSRLLAGRRPASDSYFTCRARASGLRILGRTAMSELGTSGFTESYLCGITRNPWNPERTAGGSSGGAAAAVAAGIVPLAHGGDGGGSLRIPAACCGVIGLNPSRGRISWGPDREDPNFGLTRQFVLCRSVRDMATALDVFSGAHPGDPFEIVRPERPFTSALLEPAGRLRIGVALTPWGSFALDPAVRTAVAATADCLARHGHEVEEIKAPYCSEDYECVLIGIFHLGIGGLERAAAALGRRISAATLEPINLALYESGRGLGLGYAGPVLESLRKIRSDVGTALAGFDALVTPTLPTTALPHGTCATTNAELSVQAFIAADAALYQYLGVFNVTGQPSVSLPLAWSPDGLPIGIQIVGRFGDEATLVRLARDLEQWMPWAARRPPLHASRCNGAAAPTGARFTLPVPGL